MKQFLLFIFSIAILTGCSTEQSKESKAKKTVIELTGNELKIVCEIYLKPDASKAMKPVFEKVIAASQAEDGCLYYDLHKDVSDTTETRYMMIEIWKDQKAIDIHNESNHFKDFSRVARDYMDSIKLSVVEVSK